MTLLGNNDNKRKVAERKKELKQNLKEQTKQRKTEERDFYER